MKEGKWVGIEPLCGTYIVKWQIEPGESLDDFEGYRMLVHGTHRIIAYINFNCTKDEFGYSIGYNRCSNMEKIYSNEFTIKEKQ